MDDARKQVAQMVKAVGEQSRAAKQQEMAAGHVARLAVEVGSNVGEGQVLWVSALPEQADGGREHHVLVFTDERLEPSGVGHR